MQTSLKMENYRFCSVGKVFIVSTPPPFKGGGGEQKIAIFKKGGVAEGQKKGGVDKKGGVVQKRGG